MEPISEIKAWIKVTQILNSIDILMIEIQIKIKKREIREKKSLKYNK